MKTHLTTSTSSSAAFGARVLDDRLVPTGALATALGRLGLIGLLLVAGSQAFGQSVRFTTSQVRVTVPINSTNTFVITNLVNVSTDIVSAVTFDISGLPAGTGTVLTDTNGNSLLSTSIDTNLWITLSTTNIPEGLYPFYLNASGGATNRMPFILQAAHIWNGAGGALQVTNLVWSAATNWLGGVPGAGNDVVFTDIGAQTNVDPNGFAFTNSYVDVNTTIGSLRFSQTSLTNAFAVDTDNPPRYHTIFINPNTTLTVAGTNGFSLLHDYIENFYPLGTMGVTIAGGAGSKLVVSNETAKFGILIAGQGLPSLSLSNLQTFVAHVNRFGVGEYQIYPNYRDLNGAFNGGRDTTNYASNPRVFPANIYLARTNFIKAVYRDPDNYENENTRAYGISQFNGEQNGNGSTVNTFFLLGATNTFFADSVCFICANHATGNGGGFRFGTNNGAAVFRGTNGGTTRMSIFAVADDGGTNQASSNVKATIDFAAGNGKVDMLADRFYISRDRTLIKSNDNPTAEATFTMGLGTIDVNTAILGFQEHSNKIDWTAVGGQVYRGYCRGTLIVTNGGTFRVNGNLSLGYTADTNPEGSAQQFNTYGQITVYSGSTLSASNIIADGGLNFVSLSVARQNNITLSQGTLVVSNSMGAAPGMPVDNLNLTAGTITLFVTAGKTNVFVRSLVNSGNLPTTIKIASVTGVTSYPTNIPLISYETATPFLTADVSSAGLPGVQGYVLNNTANKTIDLFLTTNAPKTLIWSGSQNGDWDLLTKNWVTTNGVSTNFTLGDVVTFDDSTSVTNITITETVVPNQSTNAGVTFSNSSRAYIFGAIGSGGIVGTAKLVKQGAGGLTFNATETGPIFILAGAVDGSGTLGATTVASNAVVNFSGTIGGVTSTGTVVVAVGGVVSGGVSLQGGTLVNNGTVSTRPGTMTIVSGVNITNNGTLNVAGGNWDLPFGATLANNGTINLAVDNAAGRLNFEGTLFGAGSIYDPDGGLTGVDARLASNPLSFWSPGTNLYNTIGTMFVGARVDLNNTPGTAPFGVAQLRIEVDFNDPQTNDLVRADKWNNITGMILMTNINPGAGSFTGGQVFQVFANNNGLTFSNTIDVTGSYPLMWPPLPAPGLQWGLFDFRAYGTVSITNTPLVWDGTGGGVWDTNAANTPWKGGKSYSDNQGAMFDDSASGSTVVNLSSIVAPGGYTLTTNIVGGVTNIMASGPAFSPAIVVSNSAKDYTIAGGGRITGIATLYKTGPGTLTLLNTNDYTGNTIIVGGTVVVSNPAAPANALVSLGTSGNNNEVLIDGATLKYVGTTNVALNNHVMINPGGATIEVTSSTNEVGLGNKVIVGSGALTKTGPGALVLSSTSDNYVGTTISAGALRLTAAAAGPGPITVAGNSTLQLTNGFTFTNRINVAGAGTTLRVFANATNVSGGTWTGSGNMTISSTGTVQLVLNADISGFSGNLSQGTSTNSLRFNNATNNNNSLGSAAATFDLGTGASTINNLNGGGVAYDLGALLGGPNTVLYGRSTNTPSWPATTTYRIGGNNSNSVFYGKITNGLDTVSVTKVGTGALLLNGLSTFSGLTTVSAGTLGGTGAISGSLIVQSNATLAPGTSLGFFTVGGTVNLNSNSTTLMEINRGLVPNSDRLVAPSVVAASTAIITVTNVGASVAFQDSFTLFSTPLSGSSYALNLPALSDANLYWTNKLGLDGRIEVAAIVNPLPPPIGFVRNGNQLTLSWPPGHQGWTLLTNAVSLLDTNAWFPYPGSSAVTNITITIDVAQPNVFYRLAFPYP